MRQKFHCSVAASFLVLGFFATASSRAADPFNPAPTRLDLPGDDASFQRLTVDSGGKTPTAKKLDPAWVKSLADRGDAEVYTKANSNNFTYIGMPIGGIGAGELYLSGDGRLWEWDIFNTRAGGGDGFPAEQGDAYKTPHVVGATNDAAFQTVIAQGFALRTKTGNQVDTRALDKDGFADVRFRGQYPIGYVDYTDPACPVQVNLEAFSPYNPGSVADSTYPATILNYTLTNTSNQPVECTLGGWLENGVAPRTRFDDSLLLRAKAETNPGCTLVGESVEPAKPATPDETEPIGDIESGNYTNWTVEGTAFGSAPRSMKDFAYDFRVVGMDDHFIDSMLDEKDDAQGKLTSKPFTINRPYLRFRIGGGKFPNQECINLLIDGQVVETTTGSGYDPLGHASWDVKKYQGKTAQVQIVDAVSEKGGHIMVDRIEQGNADFVSEPVEQREDVGTMALASLGESTGAEIIPQVSGPDYAHALFDAAPAESASVPVEPHGPPVNLVSGIRRHVTLAPGQKVTFSFVVTWDFPNALPIRLRTAMNRQYSVRFKSAPDVATHIAADFKRLADTTRLWHDTWYGSTLPQWFLNRTFLNVSTLATSTSYLLADGRFYGFEGRYSCPGTCTHVWGYQPAIGFLFPELEKSVMEKVEFVPILGMNPQGGVAMRGEFDKTPPVDGQAGIVLRTYLAHKMSSDDAFLQRNYDSVKKAMDYLTTSFDSARAGILVGGQANTMDGTWWGKIPWLSLHYQAALRAMAEMADDKGDHAYATQLRGIADHGRDYIENHLWNGEYFFHEADPNHDSTGTYDGCPIEQLMGQSWAYAVGLGNIIDPQKANRAIEAIWQYDYTTDAGLYRQSYPDGRWYASPGESGLIMCTFPRSTDGHGKGDKNGGGFCGYDREMWTGSEYEITAAMMWEGQVDKALAEVRSINDRYNGAKRNPWDECECGSHYSRAMSGYGVFIAACGYEYDGPKGTMAFAPRVHPEDFQAAFTAAEGWGRFSQKTDADGLTVTLDLRHGHLKLNQLALMLPAGKNAAHVTATVAGHAAPVTFTQADGRVTLVFSSGLHLAEGEPLQISLR
jgi:non-lysosomal glucosylceramidase